ncbi:MAG: DUF4198 domain-containing protein [Desulfobacterales bacterium]|nr:DUF4198 domain-containing protein [Desulfobacterales bacterium]
MKTKLSMVMLFSVLSLMVFCPLASAHNLWLNPGNYYPEVGTTVDIGIAWGHKYPANRIDQEFKEDRLEEISAVDPDGLIVELTKVSSDLYKLNIEKAGVYLITAKMKSGFFTMTKEGRKWGDRKSVDNPLKCTNFHLEAKTVIIAGGSEKNLTYATGKNLELIPLKNLQNLKKGDQLPLKTMFDGRPLPKIAIRATYAGFEQEHKVVETAAKKKKSHEHGAGGHFPVETSTDDLGQAEVPMDQSGYWLVMLSYKCPYPDAGICDESMYNMTFAYQVR